MKHGQDVSVAIHVSSVASTEFWEMICCCLPKWLGLPESRLRDFRLSEPSLTTGCQFRH
jgi:hypothetical protein